MGVSIEQWRAAIGKWSGGTPRNCVPLQNCIAETSNHISYKQIRFLVLVSLLVIGCVELNPGPDNVTSATSEINGTVPEFSRRNGTDGLHGKEYEIKMNAFLFARSFHKTEDFRLASNVNGAGVFDDLVLRYRLKEPDVWKTCFIQLKHKMKECSIMFSSLIEMSGDFSLFRYFKSYCQIKSEASTHSNLKHCGPFNEYEFVIYTNAMMGFNSAPQGDDSDTLSILSSGTDCGKCITFDEKVDTQIFTFFKKLSEYNDFLVELDNLFAMETFGNAEIHKKIKSFQGSVTNNAILKKLNSLKKSNLSRDHVKRLIGELENCDFNLYKEFLSKVKIFHSQSNKESLKGLIEKELNIGCQTSPSLAKSIYTKFEKGIYEWWEKDKNAPWLSKNSPLWQDIVNHLITAIKEISEPQLSKFADCGICFNQQHIQRLCGAIKHNTLLNIVTNSNIHYLHQLKTYQALNNLGYTNSLFIGAESLKLRRKNNLKYWPSKWSAALVIDCDCDVNVADILLGILQDAVGCEQGLESSDENFVETLVAVLEKYEQKVILISTGKHINFDATFQGKYAAYEDNFVLSDLDEKSQIQILKRTVNFQGKDVTLDTLLGTDLPECIKSLVDSDVISILFSNEHKLCVGKQLSDISEHYVPRVLQRQIYLKDDILKLTHKTITFAVSGLQAEELKKYLPAGEKLCEFVYDERERIHSFEIVSDFSTIDPSTEWGAIKSNQNIGQKLRLFDDMHDALGERKSGSGFSESIKNIPSRNADNFSESGFSAELDNKKAYNKIGQKIKPEEVRYIILRKNNPDDKFMELKALLENIHWVHVEEGSFLWRDSNCNIDIIRRYIDETKCRKYHHIESVMEQSDRTMLLVAEPGMGKSTFLSHLEHEIKKWNPAVWVLRINLNEHTLALEDSEFEEECPEKCQMFLWSAAHSPEQCAAKFVEKIFLQALEQTGKMVIMLDSFDEISPDYTTKVNILISAIKDKTASQILVSSRFSYRQNLEDIAKKLAITIQPFSPENQIEFLDQYWNKGIEKSKQRNLRTFAKTLLTSCSQNFNDKDGEFTSIPLQTMMLGEAFLKEAEEYCSKGDLKLPEKLDLLDLFNKFWEVKCKIYFSVKNATDTTKPKEKREKESYLRKHTIAGLISLFSPSDKNGLLRAIGDLELKEAKRFVQNGEAEKCGIIRGMRDGKPHFVHRCFAEYFAAVWFGNNFMKCKDFFSDTLFNSTYEVTRNIFDRMLAKDYKIHGTVLSNDNSALEEFLKNGTDVNISDKGGRTALHLAASYNSPVIQKLLSFPGVEVNKQDKFLEWTPLRYAVRTKSWMAIDALLQKGANPDDIVLTILNSKAQEFKKEALWECASEGHTKLLECMLNCGTDVDEILEFRDKLQGKNTLLHIASNNCQVEVIRLLVEREASINIRNAKYETALHLAAVSGSAEIIKILLDKGMCVDVMDEDDNAPLHLSAACGNLEATKALAERGAALNKSTKNGYTPLHLAAGKDKLEVVRYLTEKGADINIRDVRGYTVLHRAISVEMIKILLDKGMSVDVIDKHGFTPLHISAECGNLEATKALVERGAALNKGNGDGHTPLYYAAAKGKVEVFRYLTEKGADINILDTDRGTVLHLAAISGSVEIIKILLDKGMCVNVVDKDDITPLHFSAAYGHLEATKALVERGAALNKANRNGYTPLLLAAGKGKIEVLRYLTEKGADINFRDVESHTVLHHAAISGSVEIIKILLDKGMCVDVMDEANNAPLHLSAACGNLEATKALAERGAALNIANKNGHTPLHLAAGKDKLEVVRYLTEKGADINIRDVRGYTVLHRAISGSVEMIKILLDKGISVDVIDKHDFTPLHISAECGHLEATKALVERGAALNKANKDGHTPLYYAAAKGKVEVFRYLTEKGADINILDTDIGSVLHLAAISGSVEIIKILLDKGMCVDVMDEANNAPLHLSAACGNLEATKALAERGAALNIANKNGHTPLHLAAGKDKLEVVRYLTEKGADINFRDVESHTVLHHAAISGSVEIIKMLLDKGMCVDVMDEANNAPLHLSAACGNLEATKVLAERGAALNIANKNGHTPLHLAAGKDKLEVVRYLTEKGADINIRDVRGYTVLHRAISGSVEMIKILLDKGISVDVIDKHDFTPLHISAECGHLEATKALVERGAALNKANKDGHTPLYYAAAKGKVEVFRYLTEKGADINILDTDSGTVLHLAAISGSVEIIKILLDKGMCVDVVDEDDITPLHLSAAYGHLEATKALVERGAALNKANKNGCTPLLLAAAKGKIEVLRYLTEKGADINFRDVESHTVLHHAAISGSVEIIKMLLDKGMCVDVMDEANNAPLHLSAACGNLEATKVLAERGAALNIANKNGHTPLHLAAGKDKLEVVRYLTEKGADINIRDVRGYTVLHRAISGSVEMIKILLDKGISVDVIDKHDFTPLHISAECGHLEATKALVERGAALNKANKDGHTPLYYAAAKGKVEVFRYLTEKGADINILDTDSGTVLHLAAISGSVEIIKILLDKGMCVDVVDEDDITPLHLSAAYGHLEATNALVERGAALNKANKNGCTPLLLAAAKGKIEVLRYLTEKGADINFRDVESHTVLHHAAISGSVEIIKILLDKGMCVDVMDEADNAPLHLSAACGNLEATKALVERGAAFNKANKDGHTPLYYAAAKGKVEVFRYLTEKGADINILDTDSGTVLHLAAISGSVEIIKILLDKGMCVDVVDEDDITPLHFSAAYGHLEATKALVERGAAFNKANKNGYTPLLLAELRGQTEIFRYLSEIGSGVFDIQ